MRRFQCSFLKIIFNKILGGDDRLDFMFVRMKSMQESLSLKHVFDLNYYAPWLCLLR